MNWRIWPRVRAALRRYFVAGLLVFAPVGITIWSILFIVGRLDNLLLPKVIDWLFPTLEKPPDIPPFVGMIFTLGVILLSGVIVRHFFGNELIRFGERLLSRVPVARSIYYGVKQLFEAILSTSGATQSFNRVVLIEYPRKGIWGLAFVTGPARGILAEIEPQQRLVNCFVPTTPNPTSGFYLLVPENDIREVNLSVEDAFKVIMSAGLVVPEKPQQGHPGPSAPKQGVQPSSSSEPGSE